MTPCEGHVWFVGAGPGAADLLTLRAIKVLAKANVVLHDALVSDDILAMCPLARRVAVGKRAGQVSTEQAFINRRLVAEARSGLNVVRLKGGDPAVFARLDEEIDACIQANIGYQIVPGITAASAAAASAGISLTRRGIARSVVITTPAIQRGVPDDSSWEQACDPDSTAAVYMAGRKLAKTASALIARGYDRLTPALVARAISTPSEKLLQTTLKDLAEGTTRLNELNSNAPSLLIAGRALNHASSDQPTESAAQRTIAARISGDSVNVGDTVNRINGQR